MTTTTVEQTQNRGILNLAETLASAHNLNNPDSRASYRQALADVLSAVRFDVIVRALRSAGVEGKITSRSQAVKALAGLHIPPAPTHCIEISFRNDYGQSITVVTCPVAGTSIAVQTSNGMGNCTCGARL